MPLLDELRRLGKAVHSRSWNSLHDTLSCEISLEGYKSYCIELYNYCFSSVIAQERLIEKRKREIQEETARVRGRRNSNPGPSSVPVSSPGHSPPLRIGEDSIDSGTKESEKTDSTRYLTCEEFVVLCLKLLQQRVHQSREEASHSNSVTAIDATSQCRRLCSLASAHCETLQNSSDSSSSSTSSFSFSPTICPCQKASLVEWLPVALAVVLESVGETSSPSLHRIFLPRLPSSLEVRQYSVSDSECMFLECEELSSIVDDESWPHLISRWNEFGKLFLARGSDNMIVTSFDPNVPRPRIPFLEKETQQIVNLGITEEEVPSLHIHDQHQELRKVHALGTVSAPLPTPVPISALPTPLHQSVNRSSSAPLTKVLGPSTPGRLFFTMRTSSRRLTCGITWHVPQVSQGTEVWAYCNEYKSEDVLLAVLLLPTSHTPKFYTQDTTLQDSEGEETSSSPLPDTQNSQNPTDSENLITEEPVTSFHALVGCPQKELRKMFFKFCERFRSESRSQANLISWNPLQILARGKEETKFKKFLELEQRVRIRQSAVLHLLSHAATTLQIPPPTPLLRCVPIEINLQGSFIQFARELYRSIRGFDRFEPQPQLKDYLQQGEEDLTTVLFTSHSPSSSSSSSSSFDFPLVNEDDISEDEFVRLCQRLVCLNIENRISTEALMNRLHAPLPAPLALVLWSLVPAYSNERGIMFVPIIPEQKEELVAEGEDEDDDYMDETPEAESRRFARQEARRRERSSSENGNGAKRASKESIEDYWPHRDNQGIEQLLEELGDYESLLHRKLTKLSLRSIGVPFVDIASSYRAANNFADTSIAVTGVHLPTRFFYTLRNSPLWLSSSTQVPVESVALASILPDIQLKERRAGDTRSEYYFNDSLSNFQYAAPIPDVTTLRNLFVCTESYNPKNLPPRVAKVAPPSVPQKSLNIVTEAPTSPVFSFQPKRR